MSARCTAAAPATCSTRSSTALPEAPPELRRRRARPAPGRAGRQAERRQVQPAQPARRRGPVGGRRRSPGRPSTRSTRWSSSATRSGGSSTPRACDGGSRHASGMRVLRLAAHASRDRGGRGRDRADRRVRADRRAGPAGDQRWSIEAGRALVIAFNKWDLVDEDRRERAGHGDRPRPGARAAGRERVNVSAHDRPRRRTSSRRRCGPRWSPGTGGSRPGGSTAGSAS